MTRYVLIPGAGGVAWYWERVAKLLVDAGHEAIAVELPGEDPTAGLAEYANVVVQAAGAGNEAVLVAQSLGGFTAPLACQRLDVQALVFVNAMIPEPGETPGAWWDNVGSIEARLTAADEGGYGREFDLTTYFLHDVPAELIAEGESLQHDESDAAFESVCDFVGWPAVPIHVVVGADDRFFPAEFQRRVASERLGVDADVLPGGHLIAQSNPSGVANYLLAKT